MKRKLTSTQTLLLAMLNDIAERNGLNKINPFLFKSNAEMREFNTTNMDAVVVDEAMTDAFKKRLMNELNTAYKKPLRRPIAKPDGNGWKKMSITKAPAGAKLEIAVQGYDGRRGFVTGINDGSWSETLLGVRSKGISITNATNPDDITLSYIDVDKNHIDLETPRVDVWRVIED